MAITAANVVNDDDSTNASSYTTPSWTPVANRLYILAIATSGTFRTVSSFTDGTGLTWVLIATTGAFNTSYNISLYRAMKSSGLGAGTTQVTLSGSVSRGHIVITEFQGVDTGGTDGSAAVVQSNTGIRTTSGTTLSITLASGIGTGNATMGNIATNLAVDTGIAPGSGYTELQDKHITTPASETQETETEWRSDGNTVVNWTHTSSISGGVAVEIKIADVLTPDDGTQPVMTLGNDWRNVAVWG